MDAIHVINIKASIQRLKIIENRHIAIMDVNTAVRIIEPSRYKIIDGLKTNITHLQLLERSVDISVNAKYCIAIVPGSNQAAVFDISKKSMLHRVGRHHGELECVGIDPQSRYCITCGQDGRAFIWVLESGRLAYTMPHHADFITSVAFSKNGQWVATGSYDRTINLLNLYTMQSPFKLRGHNSVVVSMIFISNTRLFSAEKNGNLIIWDLSDGSIHHRLQKLNDDIVAVCMSEDFHFAFIATSAKYIALYDMYENKLIEQRYITQEAAITSMAFVQENTRLAVGTVQGDIHFYSLLGNIQEQNHLLQEKHYIEYYQLVKENPFLIYSASYRMIETIWQETLIQARAHFEQGEATLGKELLFRFKGIASKSNIIQQTIKDYEKYALFVTYINENRFSLAYPMLKQHPTFLESDGYFSMETMWRKCFNKAQKQIMKPDGEEIARQLLSPFRGVSEKAALIQGMFAERRIYEYFKKIIVAHDYVKLNELIKQHPFLKELDEYIVLMEEMNHLYDHAEHVFLRGDYIQSQPSYLTLGAFNEYSVKARERLEAIKIKHLFFESLQTGNMINAFSYMNMHPSLYELPEAQKLERKWSQILDEGQKIAQSGNVQELKKVFSDYLSIHPKYSAMATVFAQCYTSQLEQKFQLATVASEIEVGIRNYILMFGVDETIELFFEGFSRTFTTLLQLNKLKQGSLSTWTPAMLMNDICQKGD